MDTAKRPGKGTNKTKRITKITTLWPEGERVSNKTKPISKVTPMRLWGGG